MQVQHVPFFRRRLEALIGCRQFGSVASEALINLEGLGAASLQLASSQVGHLCSAQSNSYHART